MTTFQTAVQLNTRWALLDGYVGSSLHISHCSGETPYQTVVKVAQLYFYDMSGGGNVGRVKHMQGNNAKGAKREKQAQSCATICSVFIP